MSFKSYASCSCSGDNALVFSDPQPLVLSGRQGLIARFVQAEPVLADRPWRLSPEDLHRLANASLHAAGRQIVFEQTEDAQLELLLLQSVTGVSSDHTDMIFAFETLIVVERGPTLKVRPPSQRRVYTEELSLEGGVLCLRGTWHWRKPALALGGVVCGGSLGVGSTVRPEAPFIPPQPVR